MKAIKELLIARATFLSSPMWEPIYAPLPWDNLTTEHKPISLSLTQTNGEISRDRASEQSLWLGCQRQIWCTLSFPFLQKVLLISLFLHCYIVFFLVSFTKGMFIIEFDADFAETMVTMMWQWRSCIVECATLIYIPSKTTGASRIIL